MFIYYLWEKNRKNAKIGSSCDFKKRSGGYITSCDDFDNNTHEIILFTIIESKYNYYELDYIINIMSTRYSIPYKKYNGTGGTEFYVKDDISKLCSFFDKINVKYNFEKLDIDLLKQTTAIYTKKDICEIEIKDDNAKISKSVSQEELNNLINLLKIKPAFTLKPYQTEMRNTVNTSDLRLKHLIISPTGTGKTVVFSIIIYDFLKKGKDIILITKKKELLDQMQDRITNYFNMFVENNLVSKLKYTIVNCLKSCSTDKLNQTSKISQIYIVNWDKLTSSDKTNIKEVKWDKFSLIIIDESHWVGAPEINNVMKYIKDNTKVNYIGFSATPIRCNYKNQYNTKEIFGNIEEDSYNIICEYSYYQALKNKDICPIKYCPININLSDLEDGDDKIGDKEACEEICDENNEDNKKKSCKILSKKAFIKVWDKIKENIINKNTSYFKKGIFWFRSRKEMLEFYIFMKDHITDFQLIPTMSITDNEINNEKNIMNKLIKESKLTKTDFDGALNEFTKLNNNAILLSVMRATEGFDDDKLEFGIRMYYSNTIDPLNESQKMGRFNRWHENNYNGLKKMGYYGSLEICDNKIELRNSLIQRFKSWIAFARSYNKGSYSNSKENIIMKDNEVKVKSEMKEIMENYIDIEILEMYEIDIEKDIIKAIENKEFDKYKIKHSLILENKKKNIKDKINTKSQYDEWALEMDYPICDELEEKGFSDFKWLFNMKTDEYEKWGTLKKICKEWQNKYQNKKPYELYQIMINNGINIPIEPEHFYEKQFTNLNDLFYN